MSFITAGDSVERMATYCRVEQSTFALLGGWTAEIDQPAAKLALSSAADHCAWRARRWFEMLPTAPPGPDAFLTPTEIELETFDGLTGIVTGAGAHLSVAFDQLLPALRDAMRSHLDRTTSVADAPVRRLLRIAITDVTEDLESAADAVRAVLGLPGEREGADRVRADLMSAGVSFDPLFRA